MKTTRKNRSRKPRQVPASPRRAPQGLPQVNPHAAGIEVGSKQHWVCAPPAADGTPNVKVFGTTTPELRALVA